MGFANTTTRTREPTGVSPMNLDRTVTWAMMFLECPYDAFSAYSSITLSDICSKCLCPARLESSSYDR